MIEGTARSMGIKVVGYSPRKEVRAGPLTTTSAK